MQDLYNSTPDLDRPEDDNIYVTVNGTQQILQVSPGENAAEKIRTHISLLASQTQNPAFLQK
jgi:hypothetical protein